MNGRINIQSAFNNRVRTEPPKKQNLAILISALVRTSLKPWNSALQRSTIEPQRLGQASIQFICNQRLAYRKEQQFRKPRVNDTIEKTATF